MKSLCRFQVQSACISPGSVMSPECSTGGFRKPRDGPRGFLNILESSRIIRNGSNRVEIEDLGLKLCGNESPGCYESNGSPPDPLKPVVIHQNSRPIVGPAQRWKIIQKIKFPKNPGLVCKWFPHPVTSFSTKRQFPKCHIWQKSNLYQKSTKFRNSRSTALSSRYVIFFCIQGPRH